MNNILHYLAHKLYLNHGIVTSYWKDKELWMCFKCNCGKLFDNQRVKYNERG